MNSHRLLPVLATALAAAIAGCAQPGSPAASSGAAASAETEAVILVSPTPSQVESGCWATFFGERNFAGDSLTLVGPIELQTLDRGSARQLRREIKSVATGSRATLVLYEKQLLSARSVGFQPSSREGGLVEKLGFGGRIESMQLRCS